MLNETSRSAAGRLHRLNPLTKLVFAVCAAALAFGGAGGWPAALALSALGLLLLGWAGLLVPALRVITFSLGPLAAFLFLVHGLFNPGNRTIWVQLGPLAVGEEGLAYAAVVALRVLAALSAALVFVLSTPPGELMLALAQAGLPPPLVYVLSSPFQLLPEMRARAEAILMAQRARGLSLGGRWDQRARALLPLLAPLVLGTLVEVEARAQALELRAFGVAGPRTRWRDLPDPPAERAARWGLALLTLGGLLLNLWR